MTYSVDFRKKVFAIKEKEGLSHRQTAARFGLGTSTLTRWGKCLEPKNKRDRPPQKINMEALKKDIYDFPDAFMYERAKRLGVSKSGIDHALKRLGVTYKKKPATSQGMRRKTAYIPGEDRQL